MQTPSGTLRERRLLFAVKCAHHNLALHAISFSLINSRSLSFSLSKDFFLQHCWRASARGCRSAKKQISLTIPLAYLSKCFQWFSDCTEMALPRGKRDKKHPIRPGPGRTAPAVASMNTVNTHERGTAQRGTREPRRADLAGADLRSPASGARAGSLHLPYG